MALDADGNPFDGSKTYKLHLPHIGQGYRSEYIENLCLALGVADAQCHCASCH
jgi:hypothetical protein